MGLEYVRQLADRGYSIIIAALPGKPGKVASPSEVAQEMALIHPELDFLPVEIDLACPDSADRLCETIEQQRPGAEIEVLINNAGIIGVCHFRDFSQKKLQVEMILHNLTVATLCHKLLPAMKERGKGYVLNISSLAAWLPYPFISVYSATKAFNRIFTKALRTEYYGTGVKIATIYFGAVDTPLFNLKPSLRKLARRLGIMITPQTAVRKALRMLFSGRSGWMPGLVNKLSLVFCPVLLPRPLVVWIDRKVSKKLELK